jgi:squalene cyclase
LLAKNNWRTRDHTVEFDHSKVLKIAELQSDKLASGYSANRQHWDGTQWRNEKNTHSDMVRTLYRMEFDQPKPFQKPILRNNDGRLRLPKATYDVVDK